MLNQGNKLKSLSKKNSLKTVPSNNTNGECDQLVFYNFLSPLFYSIYSMMVLINASLVTPNFEKSLK